MHRHRVRRAVLVAVVSSAIALAVAAPPPATADDGAASLSPAFVTATATPYVTLPGYAGPYGIPQGYFVSISDPNPYGPAGCAAGDNTCLALPRDERPAPPPSEPTSGG